MCDCGRSPKFPFLDFHAYFILENFAILRLDQSCFCLLKRLKSEQKKFCSRSDIFFIKGKYDLLWRRSRPEKELTFFQTDDFAKT